MVEAPWDFSGKVVLVTGASVGIGAATAQMFAESGADLVIAARQPERLEERARSIAASTGRRCLAVPADVTEPAQVKAMVDRALEAFGRIDILINNAGNSVRSSLRKLTPELWQWGRALNMDSAAYCTMEVGKHFLERKAGVIVNISSVAAQLGSANTYVDYAASKGAIDTFTTGLSNEVAGEGIRVVGIRPGLIDTEIHASGGEPDRHHRLAKTVPMQRVGTADEIANAIVWLMSDEASYVTGTTIDVSGGR